jgi:hypothetical protein
MNILITTDLVQFTNSRSTDMFVNTSAFLYAQLHHRIYLQKSHLFFEKSIKLLKKNGKFGFITPNTYLTNMYIKPLRKFILYNTSVEKVVTATIHK